MKEQRESLIINQIREKLKARNLPDYLGDDTAVIKNTLSEKILLSQDSLVEGVHFERKMIAPEELGWKSLAVNISDLAAMAAIPKFALLSFSGSKDLLVGDWFDQFIEGFLDCAQEYQIYLVGGDLTRADRLFISVSVLGQENQAQKTTLRSNSLENQAVYLTGKFGYSAAGFDLIKKFGRGRGEFAGLIEKHFRPRPRVPEALELIELSREETPAMIDSSDGLLDSLERISQESQVNLVVELDSLIDQELIKAACYYPAEPEKILNWILIGGEDYELVATAEENLKFNQNSSWKKIGKVVKKSSDPSISVKYQGKILDLEQFRKFDHFGF